MDKSNVSSRNPRQRHTLSAGRGVSVAPINESGAARCALQRAEVAYMAALELERQALNELGAALEAANVEGKRNYAMSLFRLRANNSESIGIMEAVKVTA